MPFSAAAWRRRRSPRRRSRRRRPTGGGRTEEQVDTLLQVAVAPAARRRAARPPGVAAAAVRRRRRSTSCCPPLVARPGVRPVAGDLAGTRRPASCRSAVVDKPFEQVRDLFMADLSGVGGHVGDRRRHPVRQEHAAAHADRRAGAHPHPGRGAVLLPRLRRRHARRRSRACRTSAASPAGMDAERVSRTVAEVQAVLTPTASACFAEHGIENMAAYRRCAASGHFADDPHGDVFLVVDGWATAARRLRGARRADPPARRARPDVRRAPDARLRPLVRHAQRAARPARHPAGAAAGRPDRLGDRHAGRRAGARARPGSGLTTDKTALPGRDPAHRRPVAHRRPGDGDAGRWPRPSPTAGTGPAAPPVRMLPALLPADRLPAPEGRLRVALGWGETDLAPGLARLRPPAAPDRARRQRQRQDGRAAPDRRRHPARVRARRGRGPPRGHPPRAARRRARGVPAGLRVLLLGRGGTGRRRWRRGCASGCPAPTSRPRSSRARDWWTGPERVRPRRRLRPADRTDGRPAGRADRPAAAGRRHRPARGAGPQRRRIGPRVDGRGRTAAAGVQHPGPGAVLPTERDAAAERHAPTAVPPRTRPRGDPPQRDTAAGGLAATGRPAGLPPTDLRDEAPAPLRDTASG